MAEKSLEEIHRGKTGKVSDKWESYLGYYDSLFMPIRKLPVSLFEIGVQNGGSLDTWAEYFEFGKHFVGCDINPKCGLLEYKDPRVKIIIGNANSPEVRQAVKSAAPQLDVVIDDGSHNSVDVIYAFLNYFPLVKPGGIFVIEDTCTLYYDEYGGGILNESGAYSFFKKLIDVINFQFWQKELSVQTFLRTFFPHKAIPGFILEGWIDGIEFKNSVVTVKKALTPGHQKLGPRVISGKVAQVFDGPFADPHGQP